MALTVKGARPSGEQLDMGRLIVTITRSRGGDVESCAGAVATSIQESTLRNLSGGDRDSAGLFQQRPSMGWGSYAQVTTPSFAIGKFLDQFLSYRRQGLGWLQASHRTQRSAHADAPARWFGEGVAFTKQFTGAGDDSNAGLVTGLGGNGAAGETRVNPYEFSRGSPDKPETSWDCIGRLADEVNWRRHMKAGELWFVSDAWLSRQAPLYRISEKTRGVVDLSFDFETRGRPAQATLRVQARRYSFLPGDVVQIVEQGPADGVWLIQDVRRGLTTQIAEVTLTRSRPKLPEPAQTSTVNVGDSAFGGIGGGNATADAVYQAAQEATSKNWIYSQPQRNQNDRYADCSSGVTWVLRRAGVSTPPSISGNAPVSGTYLSWGQAGTGQRVTCWTNPGHIWLQFHGFPMWRFDTGGGSGGKLWSTPRSTSGFTARTWQGL